MQKNRESPCREICVNLWLNKKQAARNPGKFPALRAALGGKLDFFLFLRGVFGLRGQGLGGALLEFVHAAGGVHEFLLAGVKRMADVADADDDRGFGGTRLDDVATGATNLGVHIFRVNVRLHKKGAKSSRKKPDDKSEF
jgi:hypothetical protein